MAVVNRAVKISIVDCIRKSREEHITTDLKVFCEKHDFKYSSIKRELNLFDQKKLSYSLSIGAGKLAIFEFVT